MDCKEESPALDTYSSEVSLRTGKEKDVVVPDTYQINWRAMQRTCKKQTQLDDTDWQICEGSVCAKGSGGKWDEHKKDEIKATCCSNKECSAERCAYFQTVPDGYRFRDEESKNKTESKEGKGKAESFFLLTLS